MGKRKATKVSILITMDNAGEMKVEGPMNDPVLFLGLLELAKTRFLSRMTQAELLTKLSKMEPPAEENPAPGNRTPAGLIVPH
jgi:hypothetical protein